MRKPREAKKIAIPANALPHVRTEVWGGGGGSYLTREMRPVEPGVTIISALIRPKK